MPFNLDAVKPPKRINPCPIISATIELRFESTVPYNAIIGIVYNAFKDDYPELQDLPILQIQESIRSQDQSLKHLPHYRLLDKDKKFLFFVGPRVFSLSSPIPYLGWVSFSTKMKAIEKKMMKLSIVDKYTRIGIRYMSAFKFDILDNIDLNLCLNKDRLTNLDANMQLRIKSGDFINLLAITNDAQIENNGQKVKGSIVDIDTFSSSPSKNIIGDIEKGHELEKKIFFRMLKKDFLEKTLQPEY